MRIERMYVHPPFKKLIKRKALEEDKTVLQWTREIMKKEDPLDSFGSIKRYKKNKGGMSFDFP